MIDFIITSSVCLTLFLAVYHLLLEKEKMHHFNRFYLLSSIVISLLIPFLNFEIIKEIPVEASETVMVEGLIPSQAVFIEEETSVLPLIIWSLYGLITFGFLIRFGKNLLELISKTKSNPTVKYQNANLVLLDEKVLPHTFWNSIFINFDDYNSRNIEDELYTHELVHVTQKHTFDILFIEMLKTVFWFNPLFYFYKKAIQLNHEFLADEEVVKSCDNVPFYQTLLLQKNSINHVFLTSNLNYQVTKKRLIMMTKNTSKTLALLKKVAILPILVGMIYFFCVEIVAQEKTKPIKTEKAEEQTIASTINKKDKNINPEEYFKGVRFKYYENKNGKLIFDKKYEELTEDEKKEIEISLLLGMQKPFEKKSPSIREMNDFKNSKKFAIWIDGKNVPNNELNKYKPKDFAHYSGSVILKNARTKRHPQPFQYWFYTQPYFEKNNMGKQIEKYPGDEIIIWKDGKALMLMPNEKSFVKAEATTKENDTIKKSKKAIEKVTINGNIYEKIEDKYFNEKGSFQTDGKTKHKNGYIKINNETCFYVTDNNGEIDYFDRYGNRINKNGEKLEPKSASNNEMHSTADLTEKPEFEGGMDDFYKYIAKNYKVPAEITKNKLKGKIFMSFIVETDGSLSNIKTIKDMGFGTGDEAIRILKNSPKWKPGKIDDKPVRTSYSLPITISN